VPGRRRVPRAAIALAAVVHDIRAGRLSVDMAAAAVGREPHLSRPLNELWSSHKLAPLVGRARLPDSREVTIVAMVAERLDRCRLQLCLEEALAEATGSGPA